MYDAFNTRTHAAVGTYIPSSHRVKWVYFQHSTSSRIQDAYPVQPNLYKSKRKNQSSELKMYTSMKVTSEVINKQGTLMQND